MKYCPSSYNPSNSTLFAYTSLLSFLPGLLTVAWSLARQVNSVVQLEIGVQGGGGLQAEPTARVNISIVPGTPIPPIFEQLQYVFSVPEDVAPGTSVGIVQAHNPPGIIYHYTHLMPYPDTLT